MTEFKGVAIVLVGRPGKGVSSAASALVERDVGIGTSPFTTVGVSELSLPPDNAPLGKVIDVPGLEDAAYALDALGPRPASLAQRAARVRAFVREGKGERFKAERTVLELLLAGACPVHVVDGSRPFRPNHRADSELLGWLGQPGVLLVATTGGQQVHAQEWEDELGPSYAASLRFDSAIVQLEERKAVLGAVAAARPHWASEISRLVQAIVERAKARRQASAETVARMLIDQLTYAEEVTVDQSDNLELRRTELEARFHARLSEREAKARRDIELTYGFSEDLFTEDNLDPPAWQRDLFDEDIWTTLGLTPRQQVLSASAAGAAAGVVVDVALGGASLGTGAGIGAAVGAGAAVWNLSRPRIRAHEDGLLSTMRRAYDALSSSSSKRRLVIGPHRGENLPWVLLDRAVMHHHAVATRSHAHQGKSGVGGATGPVSRSDDTIKKLGKAFNKIRNAAKGTEEEVPNLTEQVTKLLRSRTPLPGDSD